jgi:predicted nucleic-acid-binding protein
VIAFDTNYLVRHIVQDDEAQCKIVASILEKEVQGDRSIRILDLVLLETAWVLREVYEFDRSALAEIIEELLEDSAFSFDNPTRLRSALKLFQKGKADFADYLILASARSEELELKTFDKHLKKDINL